MTIQEPAYVPRGSDFFGIVVRDPWYEFNTNPTYPNALNQAFLNSQFDHVQTASLGWIRFEFHADYDGSLTGVINYQKTDWFIAEANRRGIKLLGLIGSGIITESIKDLLAPADNVDGTNAYIRNYVARATEIANRYKGQIGAWEVLNEPNVSAELYNETGGKRQSIDPDRFGTLIAKVYRAFLAIGEIAPLIMGGLYNGTPVENPQLTTPVWLQQVYSSRPIQLFAQSVGRLPWSSIGIHPYPNIYQADFPHQVAAFVSSAYQVVVQNHDPALLWITELGLQANPAAKPDDLATPTELAQLDFLIEMVLMFENQLAPIIQRWFWFKLEDFAIGTNWYNWGMLRLNLGSDSSIYNPDGTVYRYKTSYYNLGSLAKGNPIFFPPTRPTPTRPPGKPRRS